MIEEGLSVEEILKNLEDVRDSAVVYFAPANLDYLKKSGRVTMAAAVIGNMLSIRPIFKMEKGEISIDGKVRGSKKMIAYLIDKVVERNKDLSKITLTVGHGCNMEDFVKLATEVENKLKDKVKKILISKGGVCVCSHTGPDIIAVSFSR